MSTLGNVALEAVIGVLGVFATFLWAGGVTTPASAPFERCGNAAIFAAVGVLNGTRFNGGKRPLGACCLLLLGAAEVLLDSGATPKVSLRLGRSSQKSNEKSLKKLVEPVLGCDAGTSCVLSLGAFTVHPMSEKKGLSTASLGDSYAFGIAGTGGTTSCSSAGFEMWILRGLGLVARLLGAALTGVCCIEPLKGLNELWLEREETERPELRRWPKSGVARDDDGVVDFWRPGGGVGGGLCPNVSSGVGDLSGIGGALLLIDIRRDFRASVGLTVRAPNPPTCPEATDCLFALEEGVTFRLVGTLAGVDPSRLPPRFAPSGIKVEVVIRGR